MAEASAAIESYVWKNLLTYTSYKWIFHLSSWPSEDKKVALLFLLIFEFRLLVGGQLGMPDAYQLSPVRWPVGVILHRQELKSSM